MMTLNKITKITKRTKTMNETKTRNLSESISLMRDCVQPFLDEDDDDDWYENNLTVEDILRLEDVEYAPSPAIERAPRARAPRTTAIASPSRSIPNSRTRYEVKISPGLRLLEQHQYQRHRDARRGSTTSDEGDEMDYDEEEDEEEDLEDLSFCMFEMEL